MSFGIVLTQIPYLHEKLVALPEGQKMSHFQNMLPGVPDVESPFFDMIFAEKQISSQTMEIARALRRDGFAVIDFPDPDFPTLAGNIIKKLDSRYDMDGWRKGTTKDLRIQDAWQDVPEVKTMACNPAILQLLTELYGRRAFPFQTLNFPVGTQQHFHTDSIHFSSSPERFMVGVWVALEDVDSENGPLVYYPGSHTLPIYTNENLGVAPNFSGPDPISHYSLYLKAWEQIVEVLNLKPLQFHAKKGQALIWAANLLHGGAAHNDRQRTRYSQVSHYFFDGCCYYTPSASAPFLGAIRYRDLVDISTGRKMPNMVAGQQVPAIQLKHSESMSRAKPELPKDFDPKAYLAANPDVKRAKADPVQHWLNHGYREGRPLR
jgi:hypothetical protein